MPTKTRKTGRRVTILERVEPETVSGDTWELKEELLRRQLVHLRGLQDQAVATAAIGKATSALLRESASLSRAIMDLGERIDEHRESVIAAAAALTDSERVELYVGWLLTRPVSVRRKVAERLMP